MRRHWSEWGCAPERLSASASTHAPDLGHNAGTIGRHREQTQMCNGNRESDSKIDYLILVYYVSQWLCVPRAVPVSNKDHMLVVNAHTLRAAKRRTKRKRVCMTVPSCLFLVIAEKPLFLSTPGQHIFLDCFEYSDKL